MIQDTEIDWIAYMQEVEGVMSGQYNYAELKGDTGPLVYPAGFVYLYSVLHWVTDNGTNIRRAQYLFVALYVVFTAIVALIYAKTKPVCMYVDDAIFWTQCTIDPPEGRADYDWLIVSFDCGDGG